MVLSASCNCPKTPLAPKSAMCNSYDGSSQPFCSGAMLARQCSARLQLRSRPESTNICSVTFCHAPAGSLRKINPTTASKTMTSGASEKTV
jgi:hypothetical protein